MKKLNILNRQYSVRFVAALTVASLLMSAFPASFFVAEAASSIFTDSFEAPTNLDNWTESGWSSAADQEHTGNKSAKLVGNILSTQTLTKTTDTTGYESIAVSFWYRADNLEWASIIGGSDKVEVSYTLDGSTWVEFNQIDGDSNDDNDENGAWNEVNFSLPAGANDNPLFGLRFDGNLNSGNDNVWIDDVTVSGTEIPVDTDGDTVPDEDDNCPALVNTDQADNDNDGTGNVCDSTPNGDTDNDGIDNDIDNCPAIANQDQADTDNDGTGNACDLTPNGDTDSDGIDNNIDNCPVTPNQDQADTDNDGTGDACDGTPNGDADNDGIDDQSDNCPADANQSQTDTDSDEIGDACDPTPTGDDDSDGIDNEVDNCPAVANQGQADTDNDGTGDACEALLIDLCPFKPGNQTSIHDCFELPADQCPNVPGYQLTNILCLPPIDWCPLVPGTQNSIFQCFHYDHCPDMPGKQSVHDECVPPPPVDYCDTVEGVQPEDYDCPPPPPVCEEGEIVVDNECVPEPQECVNLLTNGSFETEVVTDLNLWERFGVVSGWTIQQVAGDTPTTLELHRDWSSNEAAQGAQYAELDGDHSTKVSQTVALIDGATYELKWAFAPRHDVSGPEQNQLSVMVDGIEVDTNGPASGLANLTPGDWTQGSYSFVADDASAVIAFADKGPSNSYGTFLDDARLCKIADPEPVATVVAEKVVCETEADLPNWNDEGGAPDITSSTAQNWVDQSEGACWLEPDWQFEWGSENVADAGDTLVGPAGAGWTTFGPTNGVGQATAFLNAEDIDEDSFIWIREVLQEGYIPFTHEAEGDNSDNVTAEMYCHIDGLNYDNLDRVDGIELNETYHCVAFNAEISKPVEQCTLEMYSDAGTVVVERNGYAVPTYNSHSSWTAEIPGATWIWDVLHADEIDDEESQTFTFEETFTVNNPVFADLDIAADNDYELIVNGTTVVAFADGGDDSHYGSLTKDDIDLQSYLVSGENVMQVKVKNFGMTNAGYQQNPAGLLYKLVVKGGADESCAVTTEPEPEICEYNENLEANDELCVPPPPVDVCPNLEGGPYESIPSGYEKVGESNDCTLIPTPTPEVDSSNDSGGSGGTGTKVKQRSGTPSVLGASTSQCSMYLFDYMKSGLANNEFEVKKLQLFLNLVEGNNLLVTGIFDAATDEAVRKFQLKYQEEVLTPWFVAGYVPHKNPTGWVYQLTRWKINNIVCPGSEASPVLQP